ncbi:MAG: hypothetical protein OXH85_07700, partial [Truepera sp.]|nr:hypothetical protein [Truepera sp.]
ECMRTEVVSGLVQGGKVSHTGFSAVLIHDGACPGGTGIRADRSSCGSSQPPLRMARADLVISAGDGG